MRAVVTESVSGAVRCWLRRLLLAVHYDTDYVSVCVCECVLRCVCTRHGTDARILEQDRVISVVSLCFPSSLSFSLSSCALYPASVSPDDEYDARMCLCANACSLIRCRRSLVDSMPPFVIPLPPHDVSDLSSRSRERDTLRGTRYEKELSRSQR